MMEAISEVKYNKDVISLFSICWKIWGMVQELFAATLFEKQVAINFWSGEFFLFSI